MQDMGSELRISIRVNVIYLLSKIYALTAIIIITQNSLHINNVA